MSTFKLLVVVVTILTVAKFNRGQDLVDHLQNLETLWKIPLTKCCVSDSEFYSLGFDSCNNNEETPFIWPPPVYSIKTNQSAVSSSVRFSLTYNMSTCMPGYDSKSVTNFRLYTDGTVQVGDARLEPGQFCLNQIASGEPPTDESEFAIRYCIPDPCNQTNCVHKCCPMGMALNITTQLCQSYSERFDLVFHNASGQVISPDPGSYIIRDGDAPQCPFGMFPLMPEMNPEDTFYILPDGQLYLPSYPENDRYSKDYCVDDFFAEEGHIVRQALMCFPPQPEESADNQLVFKVFPYLLLVSSLFLVATFVVYAIIPEIRNIHGVTIMCHVASLAVMYIGLCVIQLGSEMPDGACVGLAVVVHFAFLSTFTWLNVMSFDIWWTFSPLNTSTNAKAAAVTFWMQMLANKTTSSSSTMTQPRDRLPTDDDYMTEHSDESGLIPICDLRPRNSRHGRQHLGRRIIFYSIYAWGVPFIIVLVGQVLDHVKNLPQHIVTPGFGEVKCWFFEKEAFLIYLYGPIAILILSNIVFFVMTAILLYRASVDAAFAVNSAHAKQKFRVIFSLFILMGVSWMMEVISFAVGGSAYIWIPTDILNILTGVFIFVIFVCKPNVWKLLKLKCPCLKRLDRCCPSYMTRSNTRQGTTTRSTMKEVSQTKSLNNLGLRQVDDSKKKIVMDAPTQSTQLRDSTQVDSGDEMMVDHESIRMA
ncbi:LOW QUALITY PROTEIN: G-protein coupled receptor Mth2-like [Daphnia carinata]|uniref:LOW QUALITY PROTEIN: G-protein coupled receptor Mth2-like n=1 Tax=Daphnia carinata TaxID=120202 RepID=UPI00257A7009|nr:LOW QUALITY PROTEIN: G-protein coupled receptor Mth2-like [Daphnia carinata]